ncbi:PREDICTED: LOW QUALITY PROTEIN: riboflavin biosynthesis protein PYRD, chloroplastic-like [Camelina sativa]|uniref:diaminohydroxyphosphoribosylaminopyrimidine deaminase n=1 Tax=Camelina sativa TaxID=90675 RepID=A0ABM0U0Z5_CAMSA|nr:PREDICTED: LOW QUALITY PROTEIN: riboflavin biosynthesis protein PYRD, chloroplastic-like [Camelina sativa]
MQITCHLPISIPSINPRTSIPVLSLSSNPRLISNLTSIQNPKHGFKIPHKSQTGFSKPCFVLAAMRSEDGVAVVVDDAFYMRKSVELANRAIGCTSPNPMVGCVIVKDGAVVGEGFHPKAGQPHAEVFALRDAGDLAENATAYVSLEPCNHYGRTPPCTEALIKAKVKRVVIGMVDPNPIVFSSGISRLKDAGIDVTMGVEEELCKKMNEGFIHRMLTGKPFLALRYSISVNGCFVDKIGEGDTDTGGYYSKLLQEYDAIILSSSFSDKLPSISSQEDTNASIQPIQIIVASNVLQSPILASSSSTVEESGPKVVLFTGKELVAESGINSSGVETVVLEKINLDSILDYCYRRGLCSVLLDLRGNIKDLAVLMRDGFEQKLLQKVVIEVLPEWSTKDERQIASMEWLESKHVKDLQSKQLGRSVLLEGYF